MNACASATVAAPLPRVADAFPDDDLLGGASLDDFDAGFFDAVCAIAIHAASRTIIDDRTTNDLQIRFENIVPPDESVKLFSLAGFAGGKQIRASGSLSHPRS